MLSIERVKKLLNNPNISDEEAIQIRDGFYTFAEVIFDEWEKDRIKSNGNKCKLQST